MTDTYLADLLEKAYEQGKKDRDEEVRFEIDRLINNKTVDCEAIEWLEHLKQKLGLDSKEKREG